MFKWRRKCWPIGLDIGTDSVRMLQLHPVATGMDLLAYGGINRVNLNGQETVVDSIRHALKTLPFRGNRVVSCIASDKLEVATVRLGEMPGQEFERAVLHEARTRFGGDIASEGVQHIVAGKIASGTNPGLETIIMAARNEDIESHFALLDEVGLVPVHIEAEPVAMFRMMERFQRRGSDAGRVVGVVDVGHKTTTVVIARGRRILFVRTINLGGGDFTRAVAKNLDIDIREAEELRNSIRTENALRIAGSGTGDRGKVYADIRDDIQWAIFDAVRGEVGRLAEEVEMCVRYCCNTFAISHLESMNIAGGEAYEPAVMELLSKRLGFPCIVSNPLRGIRARVMGVDAGCRTPASEWALCTGLALRESNIFAESEGCCEKRDSRLSA